MSLQSRRITDKFARETLALQLAHGDLWRAAIIRALPLFEVAVNGVEALR